MEGHSAGNEDSTEDCSRCVDEAWSACYSDVAARCATVIAEGADLIPLVWRLRVVALVMDGRLTEASDAADEYVTVVSAGFSGNWMRVADPALTADALVLQAETFVLVGKFDAAVKGITSAGDLDASIMSKSTAVPLNGLSSHVPIAALLALSTQLHELKTLGNQK